MKKINWKLLIISIIIPLGVGVLSAVITKNSMNLYGEINLPVFAPPSWLFAPVWILLYILMGVSLYLIVSNRMSNVEALWYFGLQLVFNFFWSIIFFNFRLFWLAFAWLIVLDYLIVKMIVSFNKINKTSAWLQIPYLLWCVFATILTLTIAIMN